MLNNWLDLSSTSNRYQQMYIKGFLDISGGNLILRNNNFHVLSGDSSLNGRLFVNGDVSFNNNLNVNNDLTIKGRLFTNYVDASIPISAIQGGVPGTDGVFFSDVSINQRLFVQRDTAFNGNLLVNNNTLFKGDVSMNSRLFINGNTSVNNLTASGNVSTLNLNAQQIYANGILLDNKFSSINSPTFTGTVSGITSVMVGLGNVNNTSDVDKPISSATQTALNLLAPLTSPSLLGIPTAPTATYGTNSRQLATTAYVATEISGFNMLLSNKYVSVSNPNFIGSAVIPTLSVTNDTSLNRRLFVNNDASMNGNLRVGKAIFEGGSSLITKYATLASPAFTGSVSMPTTIINQTLIAQADVSFNGRLFIAGDSSYNGNLFISKSITSDGDSIVNNRLFIIGDTSLNSNVYIGKDLTVNGNLLVNTYKSQQTLTSVSYQFIVVEDMSLNGRLFLTGDLSMNSRLSVGNDTSMGGNVFIGGNAFIAGNLTTITRAISTNSNLVATTAFVHNQGYAKLEGSQFTGDVSMNNNLQVIGNLISVTPSSEDNSTLVATTAFVQNKVSDLLSSPAFSGDVTVDSFIVNNDASLNGNLFVENQIFEGSNALITKYATLASPTFTGSVTLPSTIIDDNLTVNADVSLNNHVDIQGDSSLQGNLYVTKRTILNNDVSMNKNLDLSGSIIAHNNINVYGIINQYTTTLDQGYIVNYSNINASGDLIANGVKLSTNNNGENTFYGITAGSSITTGINNTFIGYGTGSSITTGSNNIILGNNGQGSTPSVSNEITIGNNLNTVLRCNVQSITSLSDERDKTNINKIPLGVDFINDLNPVEFEWNARDGSKVGNKEFGFIAQELKKSQENFGTIIPNLIYDENPDKLEASYSVLIPIMVNAIKDLKLLAAKQQVEIDDLKKKLSA